MTAFTTETATKIDVSRGKMSTLAVVTSSSSGVLALTATDARQLAGELNKVADEIDPPPAVETPWDDGLHKLGQAVAGYKSSELCSLQFLDAAEDIVARMRSLVTKPAEPRPPRTLKELAKEALEVQDACNLSGVVKGFDRAMTDLRRIMEDEAKAGTRGFSTTDLNRHPICCLWSDKIAHLTNTQTVAGTERMDRAYAWAYDQVKVLAEPTRLEVGEIVDGTAKVREPEQEQRIPTITEAEFAKDPRWGAGDDREP